MRSLAAYLSDQQKRASDDRDLISRSDRSKERKGTEEGYATLARELCECSDKQLKQLDLSELLRNSVLDAKRIESPSAKDRALRLVRRELRNSDVEGLRQQLERFKNPKERPAKPEVQWVARILQDGETALNEFIETFPGADRQQLNQLLRNARKAKGEAQAKAQKLLASRLAEAIREVHTV